MTNKQTPSSNFINIDYFNDILRQQMGHWGIITKLKWDTLTKYQHLFSIFLASNSFSLVTNNKYIPIYSHRK